MPLSALLFPRHNACCVCGRYLEGAHFLCPPCMQQLESLRLPNPQRQLPPLEPCLSVYRYQGIARGLVHQLKYHHHPGLAPLMAHSMCALLAGRPRVLAGVDAVVPVPLHPAREKERGYNQALWVAREVCAQTGLPLRADVLVRTRPTDSQVHRSRSQRLGAMREAFDAPGRLDGLHLLLLDDVLTTGATARACAETLLRAGAAGVALCTFARA